VTLDASELEKLGIYDPNAPRAEDRLQLLKDLSALGATTDELAEAARTEAFGGLALELRLRGPGPLIPFEDAAKSAGIDVDDAARVLRASGFPDPTTGESLFTQDEVDALRLFRAGFDLLGRDLAIALARTVGAATYGMAESLVDSFRTQFELPQLSAGVSYPEVVQRYGAITEQLLPQFLNAVNSIFRRHMISVASSRWFYDEDASTAGRDLFVGFVDLVGYTSFSSGLSPRALAEAISRFEDTLAEVISLSGGRLVKLIGDGAMFVNEDVVAGCSTALTLAQRFEDESGLLPIRIGIASGLVVSLHGDYYGQVVNLASRLASVAQPSTVVAPDSLREKISDSFTFSPLPKASLPGISDSPDLFEVTPR
jgi:adenylate cyclase